MTKITIGMVAVCNCAQLAEGVVEVVQLMAPTVKIIGCGGTSVGKPGVNEHRVAKSVDSLLEELGPQGQVVLVTDLGTATLAASNVIARRNDQRAFLAPGPLVEGAVAGAVVAQSGGTIDDIRRAIGSAVEPSIAPQEREEQAAKAKAQELQPRQVVVQHAEGLGARPAAVVARIASGFEAEVTINGVDATSVLSLMRLGVGPGHQVEIVATGRQARPALEAIYSQLAGNLD